MTREDVMKEFEDSVAFASRQRMADEIVALRAEKRNNVACVKWIANAFCDQHGNPRADMPLWAHAVTDTLLLGLTPADAVVAQMKLEARAEAGGTDPAYVNAPMPPMFLEYVEGNYPPRTVISNPSWHAAKLWRAAMYAYRAMATNPTAPEDRYDSFLRTQFDRASTAHVALREQVLSTLHAFESDGEGNAEKFVAEYRRLCSMVEFESRSKLVQPQQTYAPPPSGLHAETDGAAQSCVRCGLADSTVLDLDTGSACHPELRDCIARLRAALPLHAIRVDCPNCKLVAGLVDKQPDEHIADAVARELDGDAPEPTR
jgi:hypothetical protein